MDSKERPVASALTMSEQITNCPKIAEHQASFQIRNHKISPR